MELNNLAAMITGGGSGMGAATGAYLAERGVKVALLDVTEEAVKARTAEIGAHAHAIVCDVSDAQSGEQAFAQVREAVGVPRILVNCAGVATAGRIVGRNGPLALETFSRVIAINLVGTFNMMRLMAAAAMQTEPVNEDGERGVIINTASVASFEGQIGQAAYSSSKGGIAALTLPAAREFAGHGIRVVTIAPGLMHTPMLTGMPEEVQSSLAAQVPFPKRFGTPQEYAQLVEHIIGNVMLNGEVIRLDGAIRMQPR